MWINIRTLDHLVAGIGLRIDVIRCGDLPVFVSRSATIQYKESKRSI
jgi:hypothetical protein